MSLAVLTLAACATRAPPPASPGADAASAPFLRFAGPPVDSFTYLLHYYSWTALGPSELVVWTNPNEAYLLTVLQPCVGLQFTDRVHLTSAAHTVTRRIDAVTFGDQHCFIWQIRPIDYRAMRQQLHTVP